MSPAREPGMNMEFQKFALACAVAVTLNTAVSAAQKGATAKSNPPATPQAKTNRPATHFTQGTIASIETNQLVITRKIRGKSEQVSFAFDSQTQRSGNLVAGSRVSVQYRENHNQNVAAAVRELPAETVKSDKPPRQLRSKS